MPAVLWAFCLPGFRCSWQLRSSLVAAIVLLIFIQPLFGLALALLAGPLGALEQILSGIVSLDSGQVLLLLTLFSWLARGMATTADSDSQNGPQSTACPFHLRWPDFIVGCGCPYGRIEGAC